MPTLLELIEAFCSKHELSDSQFGVQAVNDKNLIRDLRTGRRLWPETEDKVRGFMREFQPASQRPEAA